MEKEKKCLIVIDMQKDFIDGALGTAEAQAIVGRVKERIAAAKAEGRDVIFTRDTHGKNYLETQEGRNLPIVHCVKGTAGWEIAKGLHENEPVFDKPGFGSCELAAYIREKGYGEAELIGVCTDICVISNALLIKAFCPETKISVRADCCAGVTPQRHETALDAMSACQISVL